MRRLASTLALALAASCAPVEALPPAPTVPIAKADPAPNPRDPGVSPGGDRAEIVGTQVSIVSSSGRADILSASDFQPPSGDRALHAIPPTAILYLDDGTLVIGSADGSVSLRGPDGKRRSVGFRGAIRGLTPAGQGIFAVTTDRGVMALVTGEGRVRWERQVTAEPFGRAAVVPNRMVLAASQRAVFAISLAGDLLFSHTSKDLYRDTCDTWARNCTEGGLPVSVDGDRVTAGGASFRLDDPHPAAPSLEPTFPLTFEKVVGDRVKAILAGAPGELWALGMPVVEAKPSTSLIEGARAWTGDEFSLERWDLIHLEGAKVTRAKVPSKGAKEEVFLDGARAEKGDYFFDELVPGPGGRPWILARRISWDKTGMDGGLVNDLVGAGQFLEGDGQKVAPRQDFLATFRSHPVRIPIAAPPEVPVHRFCFGAEKPICVTAKETTTPPAPIGSMRRVGSTEWLLTTKGQLLRSEGFAPIPAPEGKPILDFAGAAENDVWGDVRERYQLQRFDGKAWAPVPVPFDYAKGIATNINDHPRAFVARASDDVWTANGKAHWDGKRWSAVLGAPVASNVIARAPNDVWVATPEGLFHGTAPGPSVVRLPAPKADDGAIPEPAKVSPAEPEKGFEVKRIRLEIPRENPLTAALRVSASNDGVVWIEAFHRLVEVDGAKGIVVRTRSADAFKRWAMPEAKGRGAVIDRNRIVRVEGSTATHDPVQLYDHEVMAIHGNRAATWIVGAAGPSPGSPHTSELSPHALVRGANGKVVPVFGLPSATWQDVAATPDGGAFFVGALNDGPCGQGILFHARGALGAEATTRFRAPAALLAVTAVGADEAWAVGAGGTMIHVHGGAADQSTLASGEWLRSAASAGPNDVWVGGDGGTLLHYDGRAFHPVDHGLGSNASFTGIAVAGGVVWVVGPSGILQITRRP